MLAAPFVSQEVYNDLEQAEREQLARDRLAVIFDGLRCANPKCLCNKPGTRWTHCPAHDDKHPSLLVFVAKERVQIFCRIKAGAKRSPCKFLAVLNALHARGLWHRNYIVSDAQSVLLEEA